MNYFTRNLIAASDAQPLVTKEPLTVLMEEFDELT